MEDDLVWVKVSKQMIRDIQVWQEDELQRESLYMGRRLVPTNGRTSPQVKKQGVRFTTKLTEIPSTAPRLGSKVSRDPTYILSGNLVEYAQSIEKQNIELQLQLEHALGSLKEADLHHQQTLLDQISLNEKLQSQLIETFQLYKKSETDRKIETEVLQKDIECLRGQLSEMMNKQDDLERAKRKLVQEKISAKQENKETEESENNLINQQTEHIQYLEASNAKLAANCKRLEEVNHKNEKELEALWARNGELHHLLTEAREQEQLISDQKKEIEQLKEQLDTVLDSFQRVRQGFESNGVSMEHLDQELESVYNEEMSRISDLLSHKSSSSSLGGKTASAPFEWTPWIKKTTALAISRDLEGMKAELYDLQMNREQAFARAKSQTAETLSLLTNYIPFVKGIF